MLLIFDHKCNEEKYNPLPDHSTIVLDDLGIYFPLLGFTFVKENMVALIGVLNKKSSTKNSEVFYIKDRKRNILDKVNMVQLKLGKEM